MGKSWWLTLADGKFIGQKSRISNLFLTMTYLFLELRLKLFQILKGKSLGVNQRGVIKLTKRLGNKTLRGLTKKTPLMRKDCPISRRGRQGMRTASCERQLQGEELCLHTVSRRQGKRWAALPRGSSRSDLGTPCRSRQVRKVRGGHPGRMHLQHCCCEKRILNDSSLWSYLWGKGKSLGNLWPYHFCNSVQYWYLALVWEENHTV